MMIVEHEDGREETTIGEMEIGQIGVAGDGSYYLRTKKGCVCLTNVAESFDSEKAVHDANLCVDILSPGSVITMTVE